MKRFSPLSLLLVFALTLGACASTPKAKKAEARKKAAEMKLAIKHYHQGIDAYTNSRYAEAIKHWRVTLEKDPANPNAKEYIERAENVLTNLGQKVPPAPKN